MNPALLIAGSVFVAVGAALHVLFWVLESFLWMRPSTWRAFGLRSQEDAKTVRPMAFNQGYYNLFLAIGVIVGLSLIAAGSTEAGCALVFLSAASMVGASLVLLFSSRKLARAALIQGVAPLVGIVLLAVALIVG